MLHCDLSTPVHRRLSVLLRRFGLLICLAALALSLSACSGNKSRPYEKAIELFSQEDYPTAAEAFDRLGDYQQAPAYAAYARGLVYYDQGDYASAMPYFENIQDFMYGKQRYQYCVAAVHQASGSYNDAAQGFAALGEFEDAPARALYCRAIYGEQTKNYVDAMFDYSAAAELNYADSQDRLETLQSQIYQQAKLLKNQGNYRDAIQLFSLLDDYLQSRVLLVEANEFFREEQYNNAAALQAQGDLQGAYDIFAGLSSYRDAQSLADELAAALGIDTSASDDRFVDPYLNAE